MSTEAMPAGFRRSVDSGLILPEPISRERQVWTSDERRLMERLSRLLASRGVRLLLKCEHQACASAPITRINQADGSYLLRCAHTDRVFSTAF